MSAPKIGVCLYCGHRFDAAAAIGGEGPRDPRVDDVSLCIRCAGVSIWTAYGLRRPTEVELAEILADPEALRVITTIKEVSGFLR